MFWYLCSWILCTAKITSTNTHTSAPSRHISKTQHMVDYMGLLLQQELQESDECSLRNALSTGANATNAVGGVKIARNSVRKHLDSRVVRRYDLSTHRLQPPRETCGVVVR